MNIFYIHTLESMFKIDCTVLFAVLILFSLLF